MADALVVGAGVAGLATALFVARSGGHVELLESDPAAPPQDVRQSLDHWSRPGVPQMGQGHNIHGLAWLLLRDHAPDVLAGLIAAGAEERPFQVGRPGRDESVSALMVRRAVFEWMLRTAVAREPGVTVRTGIRVTGLATVPGGGSRGVVLDSGEIVEAPWVVDATGRRSALPRWLEQAGAAPPPETFQASGTRYYARHFRLRPGVRAPQGDWIFGPTGDLGYLRYSLLPEDGGHFVVTLNTPPSDQELRRLRDDALWLRAASLLGPLREWLHPDTSVPASPVFTMGGLRNALRDFRPHAGGKGAGVLPVGDALCHTNPTNGWGVSLALHHARVVAEAICARGRRATVTADTVRRLTEHALPYFRVAAAEDAERARLAAGAAPGWEDPDNPLFFRKVVHPQAVRDPLLSRSVQRRIHLLDPPDRLTSDARLVERALRLHRSAREQRPAQDPGPPRADLLAALAEPLDRAS
ncbi:NAD(P)/FAD-dependent oxidoreductase [Streptomyces sp. H51]|uniref:NAD(P)/FAD-dependent oxidoreductase n=1 Tax=Streptomyces sp. H51 TaxID=3111770 RepID=UPI002D79807D|nr:FAD-dependent oxidoreductase [Streptomyces sp. H51]